MNSAYEMEIKDIFRLSSGTTAFGGVIKGSQRKRIINSKAQLIVDGKPQIILTGLSEPHLNRLALARNDLRALETLDNVDLTREFINKHSCKLVEVK